MTVVAIHQPNFFPWLGYFDKLAKCDVFVFLDDVQSPKTGGTWQNRVKLRRGPVGRWITAPVNRDYHGLRQVGQIEFIDQPWRESMLHTLATDYGRAPAFQESMEVLRPLILNPEQNIAKYNRHAIATIAARLGIDRPVFHWSSEWRVDAQSNELLAHLTKAAGGDTYLCGGGSAGYFDSAVFAAAGLATVVQDFQHPVYPQAPGGEFVPGLSVIDSVMHCGWSQVSRFVAAPAGAAEQMFPMGGDT